MAIPSEGEVRGQYHGVGFASRAEQMAAVWEQSGAPPAPGVLGPAPAPGVAGILCPHDDYPFTARVYRAVVPLVRARTVVLVGVFHQHRRFGAHGVLGFDPYRAWRSQDGEIRISGLREEILARLEPGEAVQEAAWHDSEHSVEAVAYWLKHQDPELEILPVLVPSAPFPRLQALASRLGAALAEAMARRGWTLGRDVAVAISADGTHYGEDFGYTPYGAGGLEAYQRALAFDRDLLQGLLAGEVSADMARGFFAAMVDPDQPDRYRRTWCGRFAIPFGLLLLAAACRALGRQPPRALPIALGTSLEGPELPLRHLGLEPTCPLNLHHFVTAPAVAYVAD
jgi:AmmeMemoRadiSam system protein B